ncbi:MAG: amidohydrolase family protein [Candidatus Rokuibacteriota bacterium]
MTVDLHAHVIVPEILRDAEPAEDWRPRVYRSEGEQVVELGGREIRSAVREFVDVERIVEEQERAGIERTLLCPWVPLLFGEAEPEEGLRRCRIQNEALAGLVRAGAGRIAALGAVPLQDPQLAAAELERVMAAGDLGGVEVAASVSGTSLGGDRFAPFWDAADATGALVFIHPTIRGFTSGAFADHYLWNTVGNPLETTVTAAQMVMTGLLERHRDLRVVLAHGGGAILALRGRLRHAHTFQPQARARLEASPESSLRRFHYDTVTHDPRLLADLIAFAGPDRVVLGTDHPFDMGDYGAVAQVRGLGLAPEAEAAVLSQNAEQLLGLGRARKEQTVP